MGRVAHPYICFWFRFGTKRVGCRILRGFRRVRFQDDCDSIELDKNRGTSSQVFVPWMFETETYRHSRVGHPPGTISIDNPLWEPASLMCCSTSATRVCCP